MNSINANSSQGIQQTDSLELPLFKASLEENSSSIKKLDRSKNEGVKRNYIESIKNITKSSVIAKALKIAPYVLIPFAGLGLALLAGVHLRKTPAIFEGNKNNKPTNKVPETLEDKKNNVPSNKETLGSIGEKNFEQKTREEKINEIIKTYHEESNLAEGKTNQLIDETFQKEDLNKGNIDLQSVTNKNEKPLGSFFLWGVPVVLASAIVLVAKRVLSSSAQNNPVIENNVKSESGIKETDKSKIEQINEGLLKNTFPDNLNIKSKVITLDPAVCVSNRDTLVKHREGRDDSGNIDFANVHTEKGLAWLADGTGHGVKKEKEEKFKIAWGKFDEAIKNLTPFNNFKECITQLMDLSVAQNEIFATGLGGSSLIIARLIAGKGGKKYLVHLSIKDSDLYCLRKGGNLEKITPINDNDPLRNGELGGNPYIRHCGFTEVYEGDQIIGVSDGITDYMSKKVFEEIIKDSETTPLNVFEKLKQRIADKNAGGRKNLDEHKGDDISLFMMTVPGTTYEQIKSKEIVLRKNNNTNKYVELKLPENNTNKYVELKLPQHLLKNVFYFDHNVLPLDNIVNQYGIRMDKDKPNKPEVADNLSNSNTLVIKKMTINK